VFLEDVILQILQELFSGVSVLSAHGFRIIRDTDLVLREDDSEDLRDLVGRGLREVRHGAISLLQVDSRMPKRVLDILVDNFEVGEDTAVRSSGRLGFADWRQLARQLPRLAQESPPVVPRSSWQIGEQELLFNRIKYQDYLVHHPFDSFTAVEMFLEAAVRDPQVAAIKMTLYRIGDNSPLIDLLIRAAEAGIEVAVLVELKARFDERSNIEWASRLERAGVHVVHGLVHLKTHCKICLIVRHAGDAVERFAHIGTGNYNRLTATAYTDLGLFTSDPRIVADLSELFNYLTGYSNQTEYRELVVAPVNLRERLVALFEREAAHARAGRPARIILKGNSLSDGHIIRELYRTARAGVGIDLIVRGICCLRPGVPGVSDRITVRSIIGRFLEHSRLWYFENGGDAEVYLGSADLMDRNLNRRVETMCPVLDAGLRRYLRETVLDAYLKDTANAWFLGADGEYTRAPVSDTPFAAQDYLLDQAPPAGAFEIVESAEVVTPEAPAADDAASRAAQPPPLVNIRQGSS
jgi:polyphosphate kinase